MNLENIKFDKEALKLMVDGIKVLFDAVSVTLGPKGNNVAIYQNGEPHVTKDGVTVAKSILFDNEFMALGAEIVKQASEKTANEAGDGTSTSTIISYKLIEGIYSQMDSNQFSLNQLLDEIDGIVSKFVELIELNSIKIHEGNDHLLKHVATVSANNNEWIGGLIYDAINVIGLNGVFKIKESLTNETYFKNTSGMQIDKGFVNPIFINDRRSNLCEFGDANIFVTNKMISNIKDVSDILSASMKFNTPIIIVADNFSDTFIQQMSLNIVKSGLQICCVKAPGYGDNREDILNDIAIYSGTTLCTNLAGEKHLGKVDKFTAGAEYSNIIPYSTDNMPLAERIEELKVLVDNSTDAINLRFIKDRLAKLSGGLTIIYVGGKTEVEMKERKDRIEDAMCAVKSAIEEGVVYGGSTSYVDIFKTIYGLTKFTPSSRDRVLYDTALDIVKNAIIHPLIVNLKNAGLNEAESNDIIGKINGSKGFNCKTMQFEDLNESGIYDSAKVARVSLQNAASVARMIASTKCAVIVNN